MAGLWQRFMLIFKSKASRALDRAENPNETLDYSYEKQLELLQNVKRGVADVVTSKKRLQLQPLAAGGDVGHPSPHLLLHLQHLRVAVVERLVRVLGTVERLVGLGTEDQPDALHETH